MSADFRKIEELKNESWRLFNDISPRYDLLNQLLSFGLHRGWRKKIADELPRRNNLHILDLATGTADVLLSIFKSSNRVERAIGIDLADKMMDIGRAKIATANLSPKIILQHGDAMDIPFPDHSFDAVSISFGIRNTSDPLKVLDEMFRVLKPGGKGIVLEFSIPDNSVIRFLHLTYLRWAVPIIGGIFTGHYRAYKYLNQTIELFPYGKNFINLMTAAGFNNARGIPLLFGTATIYSGEKI